jgi:hypothetical protein
MTASTEQPTVESPCEAWPWLSAVEALIRERARGAAVDEDKEALRRALSEVYRLVDHLADCEDRSLERALAAALEDEGSGPHPVIDGALPMAHVLDDMLAKIDRNLELANERLARA